MEPPERFELSTFPLQGGYSSQLSYRGDKNLYLFVNLVLARGLEPNTISRFKDGRPAFRRSQNYWWTQQVSILQPSGYEPAALPIELWVRLRLSFSFDDFPIT